jgi:hypothetical protein
MTLVIIGHLRILGEIVLIYPKFWLRHRDWSWFEVDNDSVGFLVSSEQFRFFLIFLDSWKREFFCFIFFILLSGVEMPEFLQKRLAALDSLACPILK